MLYSIYGDIYYIGTNNLAFMSGQLVEIIIFGVIAVFVISKLFSILGVVEDDDVAKKISQNNNNTIKDVTGSVQGEYMDPMYQPLKNKVSYHPDSLSPILIVNASQDLIESLSAINSKISDFDPFKFIKSAKAAFKIIVDALNNIKLGENTELEALVDRRYLPQLIVNKAKYDRLDLNSSLDVYISDVSFFANNILIRLHFYINDLKEEWTFTKSQHNAAKNWYLTNIDEL